MGGRSRGSLLVVEDEHRLRDLVAQFLRTEGFQVVEAGDGPDGVARYDDSGPFDLVIADLKMPGFSGVEVCRRIKSANPDQRLMICSAAVIAEDEHALATLGVRHFLPKPYHPVELVDHILSEIGSPASSGGLGAR